ncbi:hypothetical protein VPH166E361_0097 [Vibrio phage 166E36-1]
MKNKWSNKKRVLKQLLDSALMRLAEDPDNKVYQEVVSIRQRKFEEEK